MSAPHLLLVDDSQAILAFESAVLGAHYTVSTASSGQEALRMARQTGPDAILLDLSMPIMDGEQVLAHLQQDAALRKIPVIVISTEHHRADACLRAGAVDFLPKPIRAETLRAVVERVLAQAEREARQGSVGLLTVEAGGVGLAIPLESVRAVVLQPATRPLATGYECVRETFVFRGERVHVVDVPRLLEREHARPLVDRQIVIVVHEPLLGLCVDEVHDPEVVAATHVELGEPLPSQAAELAAATIGVIHTGRTAVPLVRPAALLPAGAAARLANTALSTEPA